MGVILSVFLIKEKAKASVCLNTFQLDPKNIFPKGCAELKHDSAVSFPLLKLMFVK